LFENTSPENRVGTKSTYNGDYRLYDQFGILDATVKKQMTYILFCFNTRHQSDYFSKGLKSKLIPGTALMELETTTVWASVEDHPSYGLKIFLKNITAKNVIQLFYLVLC
jgi:hypothetical protein